MTLSKDQFTILSTETVFKSEKLQVDRSEIQLPNGNIGVWDANAQASLFYCVPIHGDEVLFTREWRLGPNDVLTQFTPGRATGDDEDFSELRRELREEIGLEGGSFEKLISFASGFRTTGETTYFIVKDFTLGEPDRDENEIQEIISLPIRGLYNTLLNDHIVTSDTLLVAKLLEEQYPSI